MTTPTRFATKIAVLLRDDLQSWQRLNVTAFLVSGFGHAAPETIGAPYEDADGTKYLPMFRQPVLVFDGDASVMVDAHRRATERGLLVAVFTDELFATGNDDDNRAAVRAVARDRLSIAGIGLYGPRNTVDKAIKGSRLHR